MLVFRISNKTIMKKKMKKEPFKGYLPYGSTAFTHDKSLNIERLVQHIEYLAENGIQAVLIAGSTGEQHLLTEKNQHG